MTFVWKHPSKYKNTKEDQKDETVPVSENTEDKDELNEPQDPNLKNNSGIVTLFTVFIP